MTTNGTDWRCSSPRDDAADAAVAADDEVIVERFEHTRVPALFEPPGEAALDDDGRKQA